METTLTARQCEPVRCALDAAADALASGEWPDLAGATVGGEGSTVAPLLVGLGGQVAAASAVVVHRHV